MAEKDKPFWTSRGVSWIGMFGDLGLTGAKLTVGAVFGSQALIADGLHSGSDLATDLAVLAGVQVAEKPADEDHHYGHRRATTLVALFVGAALLLAAGWIALNAIQSFTEDAVSRVRGTLPFWVALAAVPIKEFLYQITVRVGKREHDLSLIANGWHHRTDALTSVAAAVGLAMVAWGGEQFQFMDHLTALVLSAFLFVVAVKILIQSGGELMDKAPSPRIVQAIRDALENVPGVQSYHAFRARQIGGEVEMDIHVEVDPTLTVHEGHAIASEVRRKVQNQAPEVAEVIVHVEPGAETCPPDDSGKV